MTKSLSSILLYSFLLSSVSQAEGLAPLPVESFSVEPQAYLLHVNGKFNNLCQRQPQVVVDKVSEQNGETVATLSVVAKNASKPHIGICGQQLWGAYDLIVDVRTLNLPLNKDVRVEFAEGSQLGSYVVNLPQHLSGFKNPSVEKVGMLVLLSANSKTVGEHRYGLFVPNEGGGDTGVTYPIRTVIDLDQYEKQLVYVNGFEAGNIAEPWRTESISMQSTRKMNAQLARFNDLAADAVPTIAVTTISSIAR